MEFITDTKSPGNKSMHSRDSNVDYEGFRMCHWTVIPIKINTLNLRNPICTVACKKFPCIRTVTLLNTWSNEWTEDLCSFREGFDWYGIQKKIYIFLFLSYFTNKASLQNFLYRPFKASPKLFGVRCFSGIWTSICETTGLNWWNIEWISSRSFLW